MAEVYRQQVAVCGACLNLIVEIEGEWRHYRFTDNEAVPGEIEAIPDQDKEHGAVYMKPDEGLLESLAGGANNGPRWQNEAKDEWRA